MDASIIKWILFGLCVKQISGQCTLPMTDGTWFSSTRGTWTVTSSQTQIQNFEADLSVSTSITTLDCVGSSGTKYILRANFEIFFGLFIDVYTCLDIRTTSVSPASYIYYTATPLDDMTGEYFTSDNNSACSSTNYETAVGVHMILKDGTETNATVNLPDVILGSYNVTYVTVDGSTVTGSTMNSCNDTTLMWYSNSDTAQKLGFTSGSFLYGLHYVQSGSNIYLHTYNNDSSVDSSTTYKISCWVLAYTSTGVAGTVNPKECLSEQTSTSIPYGGQKFTFTPESLNSPSDDADNTLMIVLIVLGILLLLFIIIVVVICLYTKRQKARQEEEESIIKGERQPSPDSLHAYNVDEEKKKAQAEFRTDRYKAKMLQTDPLKDKAEREHTFDLVEVKKEKGQKLQDGRQPVKTIAKEEKRRSSQQIKNDGTPREKELKKNVVKADDEKKSGPGQEQKKIAVKAEDAKKNGPGQKQNDGTPREKEKKIVQKTEDEKKSGQKQVEKDKKPGTKHSGSMDHVHPVVPGTSGPGKGDDKKSEAKPSENKKQHKPEPDVDKQKKPGLEPADGKLSVPPTQPRPDQADQALVRIRKQREEKEKERQERLKKKKHRDAEKQTSDRDTDLETETVIRHVRESSQSDYESDDSLKEEKRQKLLEKRRRLREAAYEPPEGLIDAKVVGKKKRPKNYDNEDSDVPNMLVNRHEQERRDAEKHNRKKALRKLAKRKTKGQDEGSENGSDTGDDLKKKRRRKKKKNGSNYGVEAPYTQQYKEKKGIERELDDQDYWHIQDPVKKEDSFAEPMEVTMATEEKPDVEMRTPSKLEVILQEEGDVIDPHTGIPLPGMMGSIGFDGKLPEGFVRDENGNVVRVADGKIITAEDVARQIELNRKLYNIFGLPRLVRNKEGRPLGGYKDDEFGPTAEWDYGDGEEEAGSDEEKKKVEVPESAQSRQVAFSIREDTNITETPFPDDDAANRRARQLNSADRQLLHDRLFEQNKGQCDPEKQKQQLPLYLKGEKGGVKPESLYIDSSDLNKVSRIRPHNGATSNMIARSDTFNDARMKRGQNPNFKRSKLRSSWTAPYARNQIPEGVEVETNGNTLAAAPLRRNLGSDDEFVLVRGSMQKLPRREESLLSDISMRTAPDSMKAPDERQLRPYFGDFYKDKKYFDHYLATEELKTNAAVETRELATHGIDFLFDRAEYWKDNDPVPPHPPASTLGLYLSRNHTMYADSGLHSMRSDTADTGRPHSADGLQDPAGVLSRRENTREVTFGSTPRTPLVTARSDSGANAENRRLTERSERSRMTTGWSERESGAGESVILVRQKSDGGMKLKEKSSLVDKPEPIQELQEENVLPGNVLTVTDA